MRKEILILIVKKKGKHKKIRRYGVSVTRTHIPPPTRPLTCHTQMKPVPGDLENSNVLSLPKTSASRDDRNHFYSIEFLPLF